MKGLPGKNTPAYFSKLSVATKNEKLSRDKHSSLLVKTVSDNE
jgi:hypothetical protein